MKALSIRAPWWWWILHGGKEIENRDWKPSNPGLRFRGPVLIHASKWWQLNDVIDDFDAGLSCHTASGGPPLTAVLNDLKWRHLRELGGHIVGRADVVDVVDSSDSPWFFGPIGLVLRNVEPVEPWACKGALGFFEAVRP